MKREKNLKLLLSRGGQLFDIITNYIRAGSNQFDLEQVATGHWRFFALLALLSPPCPPLSSLPQHFTSLSFTITMLFWVVLATPDSLKTVQFNLELDN